MDNTYKHVQRLIEACFDCTEEAGRICDLLTQLLATEEIDNHSLARFHDELKRRLGRATQLKSIADDVYAMLTTELHQGRRIGQNKKAFEHANVVLDSWLGTRKNDQDIPAVSVRIIAVAASFSWDFITFDLVNLLKEHPHGKIKVNLLLVEPRCLRESRAGTNTRRKPWDTMSAARVEEARIFMEELDPHVKRRFQLRIAYYSTIPQWHGVLLNPHRRSASEFEGKWLMLGRSTWEKRPLPAGNRKQKYELHLRVGENEYRQFNENSFLGKDRIDFFESWFDYFQSVSSPAFPIPV